MKRWFDPWPVFFKREFNRTWPFLVGFAVTGTIITKFSLGLTGYWYSLFSFLINASLCLQRKMPRTRLSLRSTRGKETLDCEFLFLFWFATEIRVSCSN
ncbi:hypothetical protein Goklo_010539 [Gossypium klotzschianum]|uniref:Uncharacterized protein n=1 Tax=Gossypium klotzschianum TaxID=34286 RepID=A0A7J8V6Z7_9ROSI|nr:hypothetical protein [Gossypium klotzschianum]